jgi:hypothetical protein
MKSDAPNPLPWSAEKSPGKPATPQRVGIFLDVLERIIADLNRSEDLQEIFGTPVSRALAVVADNNDLRIEEAGRLTLDREQTATFLRVLDRVITANSIWAV